MSMINGQTIQNEAISLFADLEGPRAPGAHIIMYIVPPQ